MIKLYSYWRSSSAYRVRIALNLKKLNYQVIPVNLIKSGGEQHLATYSTMNPQRLVPTLVDGAVKLAQSIAILEYLDEQYPEYPLLPQGVKQRAFARQVAHSIACDIQPVNNLRVLRYLDDAFEIQEQAKQTWHQHWIAAGFTALEDWLKATTGPFCFGKNPGIADVCLIPQIYNARRFSVLMDNYPRLSQIEAQCLELTAFDLARPENQPDAVRAGA